MFFGGEIMGNIMSVNARQWLRRLATIGILSFFQPLAMAHHSVTGEFDTSVEFELRGTLTAFDWANPHIWYYLDVVNASGEIEKWQCATGTNPNRLVRAGWQKEDLPIGSKVWISRASPAREGEHTCIIRGNLAFDDGTPVFSGQKPE